MNPILDFYLWPYSRRVMILASVGALWTFLAMLVNDLIFSSSPGAVDVALLNRYFLSFVAGQVLIALIALPSAISDREARWAAYLYAISIGPFVGGLLHLYGTMSTPLVAIFPMSAIILTLYFNATAGWISFCSISVVLVLVHILEANGLLPYAPLYLIRTVEYGNSDLWFYSLFAGILILTAWAFFLCTHIRAIRQRQEDLLHEAHIVLDRRNRQIAKYLPMQVANRIAVNTDERTSRPVRRRLTMLFSDIQGFTHAADELEAEELAGLLNEYLSEMMEIADQHEATVSQVVGDGMMIFFGAPIETTERDHALRAVHMALEMQKRMHELQDDWYQRGYQRPFRIRIGINTGEASVGEFGSEGRKLYSAIGVHAKLAERVQAKCEPGKVWISESTSALVNDEIPCVLMGEIEVKALRGSVQMYEVALAV